LILESFSIKVYEYKAQSLRATAATRSASKSSSARHVASPKSAVRFSYPILPEEFAVIKVAIPRSNPALTEPVFAIEVAKSRSSAAWDEDSISKTDAVCPWPATVKPAITRVMTIHKHSTFPAHIATVKAASALRDRRCRQYGEQE